MKLNEVKSYTLGVLRGAFKNKNILDDISAEGKNLRYKGNNLGDSYLFTGSESYAEDEQIIGKWINGKPLYRRVFHGTTPSNNTNATTNIQISPILENLVSFDYTMKDSSNYQFTGAANVGNGEIYSAWITDTHYIRHRASSAAFYNRPVTWIAEYTKTTDAPGAEVDTGSQPMNFIDGGTYSTDEIVVGQWSDGKPIYRKVFSGTEIHQKQSWQSVFWANVGDLNIERIIDSRALCRDVNALYPSMVSHFPISISTGNSNLNLCPQYNDIYIKSIVIDYTKKTDSPQDMTITSTLTTTATDDEVAEVFA